MRNSLAIAICVGEEETMEPTNASVCRKEHIIPNPKAKLLDQVREVLRLKHYSLRTERTYCDWVRRYVRFHQMRTREAMLPADPRWRRF